MYRPLSLMNIYFVKIAYPETHGAKYRPVVYLGQRHGKAEVLRISSEYNGQWIKQTFYYPIKHLDYAGLDRQSYIDLTYPSEVNVRDLKQRTGILDLRDRVDMCRMYLIEHALHDKPQYRSYNY